MSEEDRNPYAPPVATVADVVPVDERGKRPVQVVWAVRALCLYLLMSLLNVAMSWPTISERPFMQTSLLAVGLMCLGGAGWVVYQVWHGKRWARVLTLVFAIVEVIFLLRAIKWLVAANSLQRLLDLESVPLVVAVCLVFLTPGRRWFDKR